MGLGRGQVVCAMTGCPSCGSDRLKTAPNGRTYCIPCRHAHEKRRKAKAKCTCTGVGLRIKLAALTGYVEHATDCPQAGSDTTRH